MIDDVSHTDLVASQREEATVTSRPPRPLCEPSLRRGTYVPSHDGCEGLYVTPTLQGSRAGGVIAQVGSMEAAAIADARRGSLPFRARAPAAIGNGDRVLFFFLAHLRARAACDRRAAVQ